jgi:hypothetical protein
MASSPISNVPSGVGGSTYYGAMGGGPSARAKGSLPFQYDTMGKHPGNLSWPMPPIIWDGASSLEKEMLNIDRIKKSQELFAAAEKNPLPVEEIAQELAFLKGLGEKALLASSRQGRLEALGYFIAQLPVMERCLEVHQRKGNPATSQLALLNELKKMQAKLRA